MLDVNPLIVTELEKIGLPVLLENFIVNAPIPCITYMEYGNRDTLVGDTLEYSEIITTVKVWSDSMSVLMSNAILIDERMKGLGYKKEFGSPMFGTGTGQYLLRYKCLGLQTK